MSKLSNHKAGPYGQRSRPPIPCAPMSRECARRQAGARPGRHLRPRIDQGRANDQTETVSRSGCHTPGRTGESDVTAAPVPSGPAVPGSPVCLRRRGACPLITCSRRQHRARLLVPGRCAGAVFLGHHPGHCLPRHRRRSVPSPASARIHRPPPSHHARDATTADTLQFFRFRPVRRHRGFLTTKADKGADLALNNPAGSPKVFPKTNRTNRFSSRSRSS